MTVAIEISLTDSSKPDGKMKNLYTVLIVIGAAICTATCDDSDNIVQLCDSKPDLKCVRNYFSKNSEGTVVTDDDEENSATYKVNLPMYLSKFDFMAYTTQSALSQFEYGVIEEFYMDKETENIVLAVDFSEEGIYCDAPETMFAVDRDGETPKVISEYVNATYPPILTAVFPARDGITKKSLQYANYDAYFPVPVAPIYIGPKFTASDDPAISEAANKLVSDIPLALLEIFRTKASYLFLIWLQAKVAKFDMNPVINSYDTSLLDTISKADADDSSKSSLCSDSDDLNKCVCSYFKKQSSDSIVSDSSEDQVKRDIYAVFVPFINSSLVLPSATVSGLKNGKIGSAYKDENTKTIVLTVKFDEVTIESPNATLITSIVGQEPAMNSDSVTGKYGVGLTATISVADGLSSSAVNKAYVSNAFDNAGSFSFGPTVSNSDDPVVKRNLKALAENQMTATKEIFSVEGPKLFQDFVKYGLC